MREESSMPGDAGANAGAGTSRNFVGALVASETEADALVAALLLADLPVLRSVRPDGQHYVATSAHHFIRFSLLLHHVTRGSGPVAPPAQPRGEDAHNDDEDGADDDEVEGEIA